MKGKTILSLAIALSMILAVIPLVAVKAQGPTMEVEFENGLNEITKALPSRFVATVKVADAPAVVQWVLEITWDSSVLTIVDKDVDIVEGPWLKGSPPRATMFLVKPLEPGRAPEMTALLMVAGTQSGAGDLVYITFDTIGFGDSPVTLVRSLLLDAAGTEIPATPTHGLVHVPPPPATPPTASFTVNPPPIYVTDTVNLVSTSTPGFDTLPSPGHIPPITSWDWTIDIGNDGPGPGDFTLTGATTSFICSGPGPVGITLTVTAPDNILPTAGSYVDNDSEKKVITQLMPPSGGVIDVYTEHSYLSPDFGPNGPNGRSDPFGPQEAVTVYAKVTYGTMLLGFAPVEYKPVAFEIIDPNGDSRDFRVDFTDAAGIATVTFRIPWEGSGAELMFGDWEIVGTVDIAEEMKTDTETFEFGYIVSINSITVLNSPVHRLDTLNVDVELKNISSLGKPIFVTVVAADDVGVPIGLDTGSTTLASGLTTYGFSIDIPSWAFVGNGIVYVNVFTDQPSLGGVPYCPEDTASFVITYI